MAADPSPTRDTRIRRHHRLLPPAAVAGFVVALVAVVLIAYFSFLALQNRERTAERITRSSMTLSEVRSLLSLLQDAETGQRGYLLVGTEIYLEPYNRAKAAVPPQIARLRALTAGDAAQSQRLGSLEALANEKMDELEEAIALRRSNNPEAALALVRSNRGRIVMDNFRQAADAMLRAEQLQLEQRQAQWQSAITLSSMVQGGGSVILLVLVAVAAAMTSRDYVARETQIWLRAGLAGLGEKLQGEQRLEVLGESALNYLVQYLDAQVGALYLDEQGGGFRRVAGYAIPADAPLLRPGEGLLGQAAQLRMPLQVRDVPQDYLPISSTLGSTRPRSLLLAPAVVDGRVQAIVELGFLRALDAADTELMQGLSHQLGVAVRSSRDRSRLEELLEETQRQAEELQAQQEELRVNNEELEEQSRALNQSQLQLQNQQAELEQTNAQLEEQTQLLEHQRDELAQSQSVLAAKAQDLERANQYKSEFLANMSHELRTPLNSTLILAKLLSDNKGGNLTPDQVKYAETITSAGNDLLHLINDILDLSKIEAGKVELQLDTVPLAATVETLVRGMQPQAQQKGLRMEMAMSPGLPEHIVTDTQRLGQILKNLLSNAVKFTSQGSITVAVHPAPEDRVTFEVRDTGIGIAPENQELIFEAFRQADGSTHRKYGGTGLGLSISRDLARLLDGTLRVDSVPGQGSSFSLCLPRLLDAPGAAQAQARMAAEKMASAAASAARAPAGRAAAAAIRRVTEPPLVMPPAAAADTPTAEAPAHGGRMILVVEDDLRFADILRDLAHEMDFACVLAHNATEGLQAAITQRPSAILLDMHLPDHSGLTVLDQLKRDVRTRHIPVHVLSVSDYMQEAMGMGAVGYDLKPVKRAQLVSALQRLEAKFSQRVRRVLVVEDDERQRESIHALLGHADVQIVGVDNAQSALEQLRGTTFDCMIMDLNLPDVSGYQLLEQMEAQEQASFPPVIVYTGRSITPQEEQRLRRFSKSIIIKDARSPERLLDEVTLFLHQVEASLPAEAQRMLQAARDRDSVLDGRTVLVVEDDVRNIFALTSVLEPKGARVELARNGLEALAALERSSSGNGPAIDLVLMDIMMPEMDGLTAMREIRKQPEWRRLPIIALTAKAMRDDQERCLAAGANDYIAKPLDVERLMSLVRVWMPK